ncbi:hypothetical protein BDF21DRAFT_244349 [Thamnidium elegans]|nr:hypothetical protein BDF21DRAFT_244349 [Thamnidium elegans]
MTDTSDSDITIDENATRRSGRKRKDISYKDYYVPEQVKKSRSDPTLPLKNITNNITPPVIMQKKQLFCDKDLDPLRPRSDSLDDLSIFHDWIDNLSEISDDDEPEQVIPKCCSQAKEYCTARTRERPDLCGRCNRHYQIYGLLWPMRKIRKPNGRSKKPKESSKNISLSAQPRLPVQLTLPPSPPVSAILTTSPVRPFVNMSSIKPVYPMHVMPPIHAQPPVYTETSIHTPSFIHPIQSTSAVLSNVQYTPTVRSKHSSKATKLIMPRPPKVLQPEATAFSEPLIISTWPLDKSIPKMHTNNLSVKQKKRERALAFKLKRELYPRNKEPYKLVGLDAELKEKQERLGGLQLENIYLLDLRNRLKRIVSHRCVVVDTSSLPLLEIGRPEQRTYDEQRTCDDDDDDDDDQRTDDEQRPDELDRHIEDNRVDLVDTDETAVLRKPLLNMTKVEPSFEYVSFHNQSIDDGATEHANMTKDTTVQHANVVEETMVQHYDMVKDTQIIPIEKGSFVEKDIVVKREHTDAVELTQRPSQNYVFVHHQKQFTTDKPNQDDTYHPLDTSKNAKITPNLHEHIEKGVPDKIVFRCSQETPNFIEHRQVKQEPEEVTVDTCTQLEATITYSPPLSQSPSPPSRSPSSSPSPQQQSPMKVSFILQPTNESPGVQQCVYINKPTKLKARKKSARKGCPIAPPSKEPFELKQNVTRSKFRDAPPPRTIPAVPSKESTRQDSTNSTIGPFVPIEPNNC